MVDAFKFTSELQCGELLKDRRMEAFDGDERSISHLLIDQVEFANTIIINKCDLVSDESVGKLQSFLQEINPKARVLKTIRCDADLNELLDTKR